MCYRNQQISNHLVKLFFLNIYKAFRKKLLELTLSFPFLLLLTIWYHANIWIIIKKKFTNYHTLEQIMIVLDIIRHLFMSIICGFLDLLKIPVLIDFNWLCNLAFSCIASLICQVCGKLILLKLVYHILV